nr:RNA-directed DNA polymerase, eukaryota, reverse transcriptase zinc-binding domain protein [Tanacetum cinerariifolium]
MGIEADENTKFFHGIVKKNRRDLAIKGAMKDGSWFTDPGDIKDIFRDFFVDTFKHFEGANDCGSEKSPGPDGFSFAFYKKYWDILKKDIMAYVREFFETGNLPPDRVMVFMGFGCCWRSWIRGCLISAKASVLINGSHSSEFSLHRGLRQGDPLSPFLFILVMEALHVVVQDAIDAGLYRGVQVRSIHISHLLFADDVLFLGDWSRSNIIGLVSLFHCFYNVSGLKINLHKSSLYGIGIDNHEISILASFTGCSPQQLPFTYLSISVGSLGVYYLSLFHMPRLINKRLESLRANFFWGCTDGIKKNSMDLLEFGFIFKGSVFFHQCGDSSTWARIVGTINTMHDKGIIFHYSIKRKVKDGSTTRFWRDAWIGDNPLERQFPRLFCLEANKDCLVRDRWQMVGFGVGLVILTEELPGFNIFTVKDTRIHSDSIYLPDFPIETRCNPNNVRLTVLTKLQDSLDEEAILEQQILDLMHRLADRFTDRRVEINNMMVLQDHPLIDYDKDTIQLETAVTTISQEYLLEFTSEYAISEALHPKLPGPEDRIVDFPEGKVKEYQEKDKIRSKSEKNGKRGEVGKSQEQLQWREHEKLKKM